MKKSLALLLAAAMTVGIFAGCSNFGSSASSAAPAAPAKITADDIADEMTSADGKYQIAFVTDVGQLKDKSFNQGTFDGVKLYANAAGKSYKYYQPAGGNESTDDDRYDAMKLAAENGAEVIVCAGFMQGNALARAGAEFPNVRFIFIDGWGFDDLTNITGISFKEEQCGYLAGYAAVMDGYTKLGFSGGGGGTNDACNRYGYGFVQGADAAAAEMGVEVEMKYWYSGSFQPNDDIQVKMSGWYTEGTEIVFACGGSIYLSAISAAESAGAKVIGVDVDQYAESDLIVTSAMKELATSTVLALTSLYDNNGTWDADHSGKTATLGAADGCVGLPTADTSWRFQNYTVAEYEELFQKLVSGEITVDNSSDDTVKPETTNVVVDYQG